MKNNYNPTPTTETTNNSKIRLLFMIAMGLLLFIGLIAVIQRVIFQNRASTTSGGGGACQESWGTCSLDKNTTPPAFINSFVANGGKFVVKRSDNNTIVTTRIVSATSVEFKAEENVNYICTIEKSDGSEFENVCLTPAVGSGSCPETTPVITIPPTETPTPTLSDSCVDCGKPGFKCDLQSNSLNSTDSCPAMAVYDVSYKAPLLTCKDLYPTLSCDQTIHQIVVRPYPIGSGIDRTLDKKECESLKAGTFDLKLSTGKQGPGCQDYKIIVLDPKTDAEIEEFRACEKCDLQSGCPTSCPVTTDIDLTQALVDVPDLHGNSFECPANLCKLTIVDTGTKACQIFNTSTTFRVDGSTGINGARIYLDDEYNGTTWVPVNISAGSTSGTVTHNFKNSGYYDVVAECNYGTQYYYCAQRITRMCVETENKCPQIAPPRLDFGECKDCALTPTKSPCDPVTGIGCNEPTNPPTN